MYDLLKHMVFTVRITHFAVLDVLWDPFFFTPFFGHCFFITVSLFEKLGARIVPKNGRVFYAENLTNSALSPKSSHEAPRKAQGLPNDAKMLPKGPKMMPPGPQKLKALHTQPRHTKPKRADS